jgi:sigma-B regulation protein RsbU (phosphoserine phosphatase)
LRRSPYLPAAVLSPVAAGPRRVLVVDDSRAQRRLLCLALERGGYGVTEAASGEEALALCQTQAFDIVLSDWMMPGMSGLDFCRAFRALPRDRYGYFILLTSKSEKTEIADGLDGGADDYLAKPVNPDELRARLRAGERLIAMQAELVEKNRVIAEAYGELQQIYDSLDSDLIEARKVQETMIRDRQRDFGSAAVSVFLRPSGHVGGDLVGFFTVGPRRLGLYAVDVAGHGVAAAMMTARLAGLFSGTSAEQNIALAANVAGRQDAWPPEMVAFRLNRLMVEEMRVDQYFTLIYAEVDLISGRGALVQAGHPHPLLLRAGGAVERLGSGGLPVGLIAGARYDRVEFQLRPGDRLFLVSDGVTECPSPTGEEYGAERLARLLAGSAGLASAAILETLTWELAQHLGGSEFPDDVSGLVLDFRGPQS